MCGADLLKVLSDRGVLPRRGRLLDIGESCLIDADPADLIYILKRHGGKTTGADAVNTIERLATRSRIFGHRKIQTLFLSEVLELTEVEYTALDVVSARVARRFDLNCQKLARSKRNTFDLVTNFGTTEHVMNQFNSFEVIHQAVKPGGYMFHQVPSTGYINHGYFNYNALMFKELAQANDYELSDLWFHGPSGSGNVLTDNLKYSRSVLDRTKLNNNVDEFEAAQIINSNICVLLRKTKDAPFRVGLEVKTAASGLQVHLPFAYEYIAESPLGICRRNTELAYHQFKLAYYKTLAKFREIAARPDLLKRSGHLLEHFARLLKNLVPSRPSIERRGPF